MKSKIELLSKYVSFNYKLKTNKSGKPTNQYYVNKRIYRPKRTFNSVLNQVKKDSRPDGQ